MYQFKGKQWNARARRIAQAIKRGSSVLDLGAGEHNLKRFLKKCEYYPVDIYEHTPETIVMDLNKIDVRKLPHVDYIVAQGLLEYLDDPQDLLTQVGHLGDKLITTYRFEFGEPGMERKNSFSRHDMHLTLRAAGWSQIMQKDYTPQHSIFYCRK
jgi:hypothetical protein